MRPHGVPSLLYTIRDSQGSIISFLSACGWLLVWPLAPRVRPTGAGSSLPGSMTRTCGRRAVGALAAGPPCSRAPLAAAVGCPRWLGTWSKAIAKAPAPASTVTIDLRELERNARVLRGVISRDAKVCAVVKNNAFGHGVAEVSRAVGRHVDMFGVVDNWEAQEIRDAGVNHPILRVRCASPDEVASAPPGVQEPIGSLEGAVLASEIGRARGSPVPIHLFVNIGDNRMSFNLPQEMGDLVTGSLLPYVDVVGIMAHVGYATQVHPTPNVPTHAHVPALAMWCVDAPV